METVLDYTFWILMAGITLSFLYKFYKFNVRVTKSPQEINSLIKLHVDRKLYLRYKHHGFGIPITFHEDKFHREFHGEDEI